MNCEDTRPLALSLKKGLTNIRKGYYYVKVSIILFVDEGKDDSRLISHVIAAPLKQVYKLYLCRPLELPTIGILVSIIKWVINILMCFFTQSRGITREIPTMEKKHDST